MTVMFWSGGAWAAGTSGTLSFSASDSDLNGSQTSITRTVGGQTFTIGAPSVGYLGYDGFGLYAYDGVTANGVNVTIAVATGYVFNIDSFKALASDNNVSYVLTYADGSTSNGSLSSVSSSSLSTLSPTISGIKKIVLSSADYAVFQDFALSNIHALTSPSATTGSATSVTATGATLGGTVNDNGLATTVTFDYGLTTGYGTNVAATTGGTISAGTGSTSVGLSLSGLSCNTLYHFRVKAVNAGGTTNGSDGSFTTTACVPGAPTIGTATAGSGQASVAFSAPGSDGGAAISGYTVTSSPGSFTGTGTTSPIIVTGLTNGTAYTFTVTATNSVGTGSASTASNSVTPKANQTITFANPGVQNFGTTPTLSATSDSGLTVTFTSSITSVCTITSGGVLTFLTTGTCTINADQAGNGTYQAATTVSQSFTVAAVVPGAPTIGTATAGVTQATVTFSAPTSNGGVSITGYTVTSSPGSFTGTGTTSPITVTGLTNGTAYTFTVTATNSVGTGSASTASNSVTPKANQTITFANPGAQNFGTTPTLTASSSSGLTVSFGSSTSSVCTITTGGVLTFLTTGTCTINADQAGNGTYQAATTVSQSFTVAAVVPGAPTIGTATAGVTQATVTFTAPTFTGGTSITSYTVTSNPGGFTASGSASPLTVTGLTNGTAYTFTVKATNSAGSSAASTASNSVTPMVTQTITFASPSAQNFGTSPTLTATSDSGLTVTFSSSTTGVCTITSGGVLAFVATGTCTINADQAGNGTYLAATTVSRSFVVNAVVPGVPTIGTATAGAGQASVSFTAPAFTGGASITSYTVTSSPGGFTGTGATSPITVTGLNNSTAYTFTVKATNSAGSSAASTASNSVTPMVTQTITFASPSAQNFGTTPTLSATSDSGLTVTFTSSTAGVCAITSGGALAFVATGTCTINADQAGNGTYLAAATVTRSFTVNAVVPGAPTIGSATAGVSQASVSFSVPAFTGGAAITGYTVTSSPGGLTGAGTTSPIAVTGLTNGTSYTFTVKATNSVGAGPTSAASNSVAPQAVQTITFANPGAQSLGTAPTLSATAGSGLAVSFSSSTTGVCTVTTGGTLTFLTTGTCTINADQAGSSSYAAASTVIQSFSVNAVVPGAPSGVAAAAGNAQATVSFTSPGFNGGSAITSYTVTSSPGNLTSTGTASPLTVTGLSNGTAYTFTVTAANAIGAGPASTPSSSVTPNKTSQTIGAISFSPATLQIGGSTTASAIATSGLSPTFSSVTTGVCTVSGNLVTALDVGICTINANQVGDATYAVAPTVTKSLTVTAIVPGAPSGVTVTAGNAQAIVSFTAPSSNGGSVITNYTATSSPGNLTATGAASPLTVTGLSNGTAYTFTVTATNAIGTGSASTASSSVTPIGGQTITFADPGAQTFGTNPTLTATASSGLAVAFTSTTPAVCTITSSGVLTLLTAGTCTITASQAGDAAHSAATSVSRSFTVNAPTIAVAPSSLPATTKGTAYSQTISASGSGIAPYSYGISSGALPAGLSLSSAGILSGTPTTEGSFNFTVRATDNSSSHFTGSQTYSLTINPQVPVASNVSLTVNFNSSNNVVPLSLSGGTPSSLTVASPATHGVATVSGMVITYTPTVGYSGTDSFTYMATNGGGTSAAATVSILVQSRPDPSKDPEVQGLLTAQVETAERFAQSQIGNFQTRLEALHARSKTQTEDERKNSSDNTKGVAGRGASTIAANTIAGTNTSGLLADSRSAACQTNGKTICPPVINSNPLSNDLASFLVATSQAAKSGTGIWPWSTLNLAGKTDNPFGTGLEIWSAGTINVGRQTNTDANFSTSGISMGSDYRISDSLILGMGVGFGHERQTIGSNGTHNNSNGYSAVVYGSYQPEQGFFLDGLAGYSRLDYDAQRFVSSTGDFAQSQRQGTQWFSSLSGGYEYQRGKFLLSPYGRLDLISTRLERSTESGAGINNLIYFEQTSPTTKLSLGLRGETGYQIENGIAKPYFRIEFQHDFAQPGIASMAYADQLSSAQYQYEMVSSARNNQVFALGSDFVYRKNWSWGMSYRFSHSTTTQMHTLGVQLHKSF
ncbi:MAG: fibronectin type III domain-containing protein [Formivibrio sp.]|nr:fibronectin type III domain-containing protein [Formivibrio sp.]